MMKIAFVLAAATAVLTTSPPATPAKAQDLKMAQGVDIQIGRYRYERDRGRDDYRVGVGPGGVSIGPRLRQIEAKPESRKYKSKRLTERTLKPTSMYQVELASIANV